MIKELSESHKSAKRTLLRQSVLFVTAKFCTAPVTKADARRDPHNQKILCQKITVYQKRIQCHHHTTVDTANLNSPFKQRMKLLHDALRNPSTVQLEVAEATVAVSIGNAAIPWLLIHRSSTPELSGCLAASGIKLPAAKNAELVHLALQDRLG